MKVLQRIFALVLINALAVGSAAAISVGEASPDFTLTSLQGKNVRLQEFRGQVVLVNFWASWCGPCRQEMPLLDDMYKKYSKLGFTILGINVEQDNDKAKGYLRDVPVTFPILFDPQNIASKLYKVNAMPTTVLVDRSGKIRFIHHGFKPGYEDTYKKQIKELVRE